MVFRAVLTAMLLSLVFAASADAAKVYLQKSSTPPGTEDQVHGLGFQPGETIDLAFDGTPAGSAVANSDGRLLRVPIVVPQVTPGLHKISATGRTSGRFARVSVLVRTPWRMFHGNPAHTGLNLFERTLGVNEIGDLHLACAGSSYPATAAYSSPAISGGLAIIGSSDGHLLAFDSETCALRWSAPTGAPVYSSPAVSGRTVVVGTLGAGVKAFDTRFGTPLWSAPVPGSVFGSATISGGLAFVGTEQGTLYALRADSGEVAWSRSPGSRGAFDGAPAVARGRVFAGDTTGRLRAFRASTGEPLWTATGLGVIAGSPAVHDDVVFVGGDGTLYATDARTGKRVWATTVGAAPMLSSPAIANGFVFVRTRDRTLRGFDEESGVQLIEQQMGGETPETGNGIAYASPAIANGVLYVTSSDNRLYAFDANTGTPLNSVSTIGTVWGSPAVSDGRVWVGAVDTRCVVCSFAGSG